MFIDIIVGVVAFVAGLLVGLKNPTLATAAAKIVAAAKADADAAIAKATAAIKKV